ncbi:unnamed protein product [Euphydryas editha]|uniref:Uncharacterized protein n=1 Tax=Euphydryas editha TaxID=104508 RepID=A0AAU9TMA4_EUPED|nr:unnamed protein product [Euphydryas editha]
MKKRKRRYWVHPLNTQRLMESHYYLKKAKLRAHSEEFFKYYRMSIKSFDELHNGIRDKKAKYLHEIVFEYPLGCSCRLLVDKILPLKLAVDYY